MDNMKRMFEIWDEMNLEDVENGTRLVAISNTLLSVDKVKQGCKISMGADEQAMMDVLNGSSIPILVFVNKEEYLKRK